MSTTTAETHADQILHVDPTRLRQAKSNYRRRLDDTKLDELADSLANMGMLEPMLARPLRDQQTSPDLVLEVVFGSRRHKAALKAKLATVPVMVREMSDDEVLEVQLAENLQREDVYPIDEADGFKALLERNYTEASIAAKIGRPTRYVVERLKLCTLSRECRKALDEDKISLGVALLLAKLPSAALQDKGLEEVEDQGDGLMRVEEARRRIELEVMCNLAHAPFDRTSLELVPAAGPCTTCPKRTGTQVELFPDSSSPDLCTDPPCFRKKQDAHWTRLQKTAKADGVELLSEKVAKDVARYHGGGTGYRSLSETVYPPSGKGKTLREIFKKGEMPPVAVGRNPDTGMIVEVVSAKDAERAIAAFEKRPVDKTPGKVKKSSHQRKEEEKAKREAAVLRAELEAVVGAVEKMPRTRVDATLLSVLALAALESTWNETHVKLVRRRKLETLLEVEKDQRMPPDHVIRAYIDTGLTFGTALGLLVELLTGRANSWYSPDDENADPDEHTGAGVLLMKGFQLKRAAIAKAVEAELAAKAKGPTVIEAHGRHVHNTAKLVGSAKAKAKKPAKPKRGTVHLIHTSNPKGTACGSPPGTSAGSGANSSLEHVTCENCLRVGPSILGREATAKASARKTKPAHKTKKPRAKAGKKATKKGARRS